MYVFPTGVPVQRSVTRSRGIGRIEKIEILLKRAQLWIGILAGITTLTIGVYNVKNIFFKKPEPIHTAPPPPKPIYQSEALRSAVEEVGASWIKKLASKTDK